MGVTLDNASNNDTFIACFDEDATSFCKFNHFRCFSHVSNIGAQAALDVLKEDLAKLRWVSKKLEVVPRLTKISNLFSSPPLIVNL